MVSLFCSCSIDNDGTEPADTTEVVEESSLSQEETVTEQEPIVPECLITIPGYTVPDEDAVITTTLEYDITPISSYTFEEVVDVFLEKAGIDDYTLGDTYHGESDYPPVYFPDYSLVVEGNRYDVYYVPFDYELHTTRTFGLQYLDISVIEYDDPEWAEIGFAGEYQSHEIINDYTRHIFSSFKNDVITDGYYFYYESHSNWWCFLASYYLNDCVMTYQYYTTSSTTEDYQIYLDICEELGLPTCDEVTEEIMGSVG